MGIKKMTASILLSTVIGVSLLSTNVTPVKAAEIANNVTNITAENSTISPRTQTDYYLVLDKILEEREVSRKYLQPVSVTDKKVFEPSISLKGITIKLGRYEHSETGMFKKYEVGTFFKVRYKKMTRAGTFTGYYETYSSTLYHIDYVPM